HFVAATAAREVVLPRLAREQHAHAAVGIDAQHRDVSILAGLEVDADGLSGRERIVAPTGPHLDLGTIAGPGSREADQRELCEHESSPARSGEQVACHPGPVAVQDLRGTRATG